MSAEEYVPSGAGIEGLRAAANHCEGCDLYRNATQTVFGAGPADGAVLIVGEQPGDREDRAGEPFVGPADGCRTGRSTRPASNARRSTSRTR